MNLSCSAMVLGVCHIMKLKWMPHALASFDTPGSYEFRHRILAIDEYRRMRFPKQMKTDFERAGWIVHIDKHMSRPKSMQSALKYMREDITFYSEDDQIVSLPTNAEIDNIFAIKAPDGRECGMVSLNIGGHKAWYSGHPDFGVGDLARIEQNTLVKFENKIAFLREEADRDIHFFEFPGLFVRRELLKTCLDFAMQHCQNMQIEQGLTRAWFELGLDKVYYKASLAKDSIVNTIANNHTAVFNECRYLTNLDPNQGNSPYYGSHHI